MGAGVAGRDELAQELAGEAVVAVAHVGEGLADAAGRGELVGEAQQGAAGAVLLDAAASTASARQTVGDDAHVADLGAGAEAAAQQAVADDDGAADAGSDGERHHVGVQASGAVAELGPAGGIGIVLDEHREVEARLELLAQRLVAPVDVRRVVDGRLGGVDEAGGGDAGCCHLLAIRQHPDHLDDGVLEGCRVGRGRHPLRAHDGAELVDECTGDLGAADVDSDCLHADDLSRGMGVEVRGVCRTEAAQCTT